MQTPAAFHFKLHPSPIVHRDLALVGRFVRIAGHSESGRRLPCSREVPIVKFE